MGAHAVLAPSSLQRTLTCAAALAMAHGRPDSDNDYTEEGTAAHEVAAWCLSNELQADAWPVGQKASNGWEVTEDMLPHVQTYLNTVRAMVGESDIYVEQRVAIPQIHPTLCAGTADVIALVPKELQVHDLKFGMGHKVYAKDNPQLMAYALGSMDAFDMIHEFHEVRLVIHQPRLDHTDEWVVGTLELIAWAEEAAVKAEAALVHYRNRVADPAALPPESAFKPSEATCLFCPAKAVCEPLAQAVEEAIGSAFDNLDILPVQGIDAARLSVKMGAVGMVEDWCLAVRAEVERNLLAGIPVPKWKLALGRKGARAWTDEEAAEAALKKARLKQEEMYSFKVISPTTAEKALAKSKPRVWAKLQPLITQNDPKPSVVHESDKREPYVVPNIVDALPNLDADDDASDLLA
jgi:hypothetical protein